MISFIFLSILIYPFVTLTLGKRRPLLPEVWPHFSRQDCTQECSVACPHRTRSQCLLVAIIEEQKEIDAQRHKRHTPLSLVTSC